MRTGQKTAIALVATTMFTAAPPVWTMQKIDGRPTVPASETGTSLLSGGAEACEDATAPRKHIPKPPPAAGQYVGKKTPDFVRTASAANRKSFFARRSPGSFVIRWRRPKRADGSRSTS